MSKKHVLEEVGNRFSYEFEKPGQPACKSLEICETALLWTSS
jgi:hypothetical protein